MNWKGSTSPVLLFANYCVTALLCSEWNLGHTGVKGMAAIF